MLWTDLFLLWNRISHITRYLLPVNTRKHCISNSLKYHASPHFLYHPIDIITLLYDMPMGVTVSIKKEASSLFTHYWLPILLILFTSLRLRQVFHFKHNLCFPASLLHTTWFQHIPVARITRKIADWLARLSLSNLQSRLLFPCL